MYHACTPAMRYTSRRRQSRAGHDPAKHSCYLRATARCKPAASIGSTNSPQRGGALSPPARAPYSTSLVAAAAAGSSKSNTRKRQHSTYQDPSNLVILHTNGKCYCRNCTHKQLSWVRCIVCNSSRLHCDAYPAEHQLAYFQNNLSLQQDPMPRRSTLDHSNSAPVSKACLIIAVRTAACGLTQRSQHSGCHAGSDAIKEAQGGHQGAAQLSCQARVNTAGQWGGRQCIMKHERANNYC
jgi:hypothetical protein